MNGDQMQSSITENSTLPPNNTLYINRINEKIKLDGNKLM